MAKKITLEIISALLMLLFVYAAINKLLDYRNFAHYLGKSPVLSPFATQIAWLVPAIELIVSVLLVPKATRLIGLYGSFCLMLLFTVYLVVILNFSEHIPCSCGGILQGLKWKAHIIFNLVFLLLSAIGIWLQQKEKHRNTQNNIQGFANA